MALGYVVADQRQLDKRLYEAVTGGVVPCLLPGALMRYPDGVLEMRYRIAGETLEQRLARPFDGAETCELLESISSAFDALVAGQMPLMNLRFAADEVVMDASGTGCRFVFLPMTGLTPNLDAVRVFFEQVAASVKPSDDIPQNAMSSFAAFFKKPGPFDILGFSRHLKQVSAKNENYLIVAASSEGTVRNGCGDDIKMELMSILKGEYVNPHVSIWYYKLDSIEEVGQTEMWLKANPNLGKTVSYETYQLDVERAEKSPSARNDILAKRFNLPMEGYTYFFPYEETLCHRKRSFWQMPCAMGADLSMGDDFCAFTFLFPLANGYFGVKTRDYITSYTLSQLPASRRQQYEEFMREGTLFVFDGTVLDMMQVYDDLDNFIMENEYDVRAFGYDPYNAQEFVKRWGDENSTFGVVKVIQGAKTESVPLGELKKLSEQRKLLFDEQLMQFAMGNCITLADTNGNRKLYKQRQDQKIDAVAAMMDAYVAWKKNRDAFE